MPRPRPADHKHDPVPVPRPPGITPPRAHLGADDPRGPKGETYVRCRICGKRYWIRLEESPTPQPEPVAEPKVEAPAEAKKPARRTRAGKPAASKPG